MAHAQTTTFSSKFTLDTTDTSCQEALPLKLDKSFVVSKRTETLRILAITACAVSLIVNAVLFIVGIVHAIKRRSPATYAFVADCALDFLSSSIVLWRYFGSTRTLFSHTREKKTCTCLGALFILAGVGVIAESIFFIICQEKPKWFRTLVILAAVGFFVCVFLGVVKYILYRKLEDRSLFLDAVNSFLSGIFALVIIISDFVYIYDERVWYLDPLLSIIFCFGLITYGIYVMLVHVKGDSEG